MENDLELEDSLKPQEEVISDDNTGEDETLEKDVNLEEANKKLFARAKKAENELKAYKEKETQQKPEVKPELKPEPKEDLSKLIDQKVEEKLSEKDLNSLEVSDETKESIKSYAKANGLSIQKALKSDYFSFLKEKEEKAKEIENASIGGKRGAPAIKDFSKITPDDYDLTTEEGRKGWEEYKNNLKKK